jgi:MarR family transcriptional regulator, transcriptional regulator for hemolysin
LVGAGLAMRERSKTDRRVKRILLTDAGHRVHSKLKDEAAAAREELLAPVGWDELAQLTAFLEQLHSRLDPHRPGAKRNAPASHQGSVLPRCP